QPARRGHFAAVVRGVRTGRPEYSLAREPVAAIAARGTTTVARAEQGWKAAAGSECAVADRIRPAGVREPGHPGGASVFQWIARGRSAGARLRAPYRGAPGEPSQGADVARRHGCPCAGA